MSNKKRFVSLKTKIMLSTLIPVAVSYSLISSVVFMVLFNALHETAKAEFLQIGQKYTVSFERQINNAVSYLSIMSDTLERQVATGSADREELQKTVFDIFDGYGLIDGSSVYFERNMYDGMDDEYAGTQYGTARSGRICYYFYKDGGKTAYLPEAMPDEIEFELPHYTEAKAKNRPIYTEPVAYEVDGKSIPMFTITYPIRGDGGAFIGAVTVDIFLVDIYTQIQSEQIYETGYIVISNDKNQVISSPRFGDIGKTREEAGGEFVLPSRQETSVHSDGASIINGKDCYVTTSSVYIPQLDSRFYISVVAPVDEIDADGIRLLTLLVWFGLVIVIAIAFVVYLLVGRIISPVNEITESLDRIAGGDYYARIKGDYRGEFARVKDSVNAMADSIETYVEESSNSLDILKNIMDGLDAYIYVTVPDTGEILFINKHMAEHFNIVGDCVGQYCYKVFQEDMDEKCEFCPCYQLDREPDKAVVWEEHNTVTKRHYRNTDCYIDWLGGVKAHLQHSVDITDIKMYMNDKLEAERVALEMKHDKEKAEAAAKAKNDFLAKMSHEIRTPMNAVMGMSELILRRELPQDVYENALGIKGASANLLSIINDILDFSKIESGMLEIIETDYLLPSLINDVIGVIRIRLLDKPVQFTVNIAPGIPAALTGDEVRIRQTLINLLSNAVKYTREGFISLTITGAVSDNVVVLTMDISDSGIGVKEQDIAKLFGDFVQIDKVENKGIEGTGLGLAIARNLCRAMGGDITVRSEYGKGSTFTVTLPQKFEAYEPYASVEDPDAKHVLLYETRPVYRESIVRTLESLKIVCKSVENISSLFEELEKYPYVFVSSFMYGSINPALSKLAKPPTLVLLADVTEPIAPRNTRLLSLPAHALSVANILNDVYQEYGGTAVTGASFIAPKARVLIVDDITANLKVAEGLMMPYEMQIETCSSGREAIALIADNWYDLVFMDHMMPEMDGVEATARIRAFEGEYFRSLPVIALTANAVSGVREMFIQNGMNDFLAKPIETAKLDAVLDKWIPKQKRKKIKEIDPEQEKSEFVDMLRSIPELSINKALSIVGGSERRYEHIIGLSVRSLPDNAARLNELIDADLPSYSIEVHGVKGVLNNMGAYSLGMEAYELERLSRDGDFEACKALHPNFISNLNALLHSITSLMDKTPAADRPEGDRAVLSEAVTKIKEAAELFDSVLALEILSSVEGYDYGQEIDETMKELATAFEHFDFDTAGELTEKLGNLA